MRRSALKLSALTFGSACLWAGLAVAKPVYIHSMYQSVTRPPAFIYLDVTPMPKSNCPQAKTIILRWERTAFLTLYDSMTKKLPIEFTSFRQGCTNIEGTDYLEAWNVKFLPKPSS
ncbi:hypothetical protein [Parendozoicomonas haliclonae]|uniref:Uncharacterized protein n=1 Tax=Parendozoicomonas haliclonae TaxID=1960125 RepID=A0A1X7AF25_9GAMM|nr:hypothetical protein [Parendozoicomonas haliclonae]SMA33922.1 hypothetical protein EHSB41UT_00343 [Parendozoicomonas haliclonae]